MSTLQQRKKMKIPQNPKVSFNLDLDPIPNFWSNPDPDPDRIQNINPAGLIQCTPKQTFRPQSIMTLCCRSWRFLICHFGWVRGSRLLSSILFLFSYFFTSYTYSVLQRFRKSKRTVAKPQLWAIILSIFGSLSQNVCVHMSLPSGPTYPSSSPSWRSDIAPTWVTKKLWIFGQLYMEGCSIERPCF
jgi:hypothetical protein